MYLCDPYFFPLYEKAQDLNLAIVVHNGTSIRMKPGFPIGNFTPQAPALMLQLWAIMSGFHAVIGVGLAGEVPSASVGFHRGWGRVHLARDASARPA